MYTDTLKNLRGQIPVHEWPEFEKLLSHVDRYAPHLQRSHDVLVKGQSLKEAGRRENITGQSVRMSIMKIYRAAKRHTDESVVLRRFVAVWEGRDPAALGDPITDDTFKVTMLMQDETSGDLQTLDVICRKGVGPSSFYKCVIRWREHLWTYEETVTLKTGNGYLVFRQRPVLDADLQASKDIIEGIADGSIPVRKSAHLFDLNEIASKLGISFPMVWKLQSQADFPKAFDGEKQLKRYLVKDIDAWIQSRTVKCDGS